MRIMGGNTMFPSLSKLKSFKGKKGGTNGTRNETSLESQSLSSLDVDRCERTLEELDSALSAEHVKHTSNNAKKQREGKKGPLRQSNSALFPRLYPRSGSTHSLSGSLSSVSSSDKSCSAHSNGNGSRLKTYLSSSSLMRFMKRDTLSNEKEGFGFDSEHAGDLGLALYHSEIKLPEHTLRKTNSSFVLGFGRKVMKETKSAPVCMVDWSSKSNQSVVQFLEHAYAELETRKDQRSAEECNDVFTAMVTHTQATDLLGVPASKLHSFDTMRDTVGGTDFGPVLEGKKLYFVTDLLPDLSEMRVYALDCSTFSTFKLEYLLRMAELSYPGFAHRAMFRLKCRRNAAQRDACLGQQQNHQPVDHDDNNDDLLPEISCAAFDSVERA